MLAKPAQKLRSVQGYDLLLIIAVVAPSEGDSMIIDVKQPMVGDSNLVGVTPEVFNHRGRRGKGFFGIDHPIMLPGCLNAISLLRICLAKPGGELSPENPGKRFNGEEETPSILRYVDTFPLTFPTDAAPRNNAMDVGMQREVLPPGMEHRDHTAFSMQTGEEKLVHGLPHRTEQKIIHSGGVGQKKWVKFIRHSKDNMEIGNREQILFTLLDPCFALGVLALGAMTVSTAVIAYADMTAGVAPVHMTAQGGGTATADGMQRSENVPVGFMPLRKLSAKPFNDLCQLEGRSQPFW